MDENLESALNMIGGVNPNQFRRPSDFLCYVVPPPSGRKAIEYFFEKFGEGRACIGSKNFDSGILKCTSFQSALIGSKLNDVENFQEAIICSHDLSIIAYLEYWEDLALIFFRGKLDEFSAKFIDSLSNGWREYLMNIQSMPNANVDFINNVFNLYKCS